MATITIEQKIRDLEQEFEAARINGHRVDNVDWTNVPESGIEAMWHCLQMSEDEGQRQYFRSFAFTTMHLVRLNTVSWQMKFRALQENYLQDRDEEQDYFAGTGAD